MLRLDNRSDVVAASKLISFDLNYCCGAVYDRGAIKNLLSDIACFEADSLKSDAGLFKVVAFAAAKVMFLLVESLSMKTGQWLKHSKADLCVLTSLRRSLLEMRFINKPAGGKVSRIDAALTVVDYFLLVLHFKLLELSSFKSHKRLMDVLCSRMPESKCANDLLSKQCLYIVWSPRSSKFYIGETVAGFVTRKVQHQRYACLPSQYKKQQLPL